MKKLFSILSLLSVCVGIAQTNKVYPFKGVTFGATKDSISATASDTMVIHSQAYAETVSIQPVVTKVSGTVLGVVSLTASIDGVNWVAPLAADTLHLSNQTTNTTTWTLNKNPYSWYRIITSSWNGSVQKAYVRCYFMPNKQSGLTNGIYALKSSYGKTKDTVTNTGSNAVSLQVKNWYEVITLQVNAHKISGTVAGTITLKGSNDGTNYVTVPTTYIRTGAHSPGVYGGAATATATDVTDQSFLFTILGSPYEYYQFSWTGSGTMAATLAAVMLPSK